ncbi:hypothetical protein GE09DRAFT_1058925 [Coniochaeta sp. 2T2.1]|nr:hypothetical protein GE09DRAFT_1058925 [Coniochaeta sp. 2T2.1]
MSHAPHSKAAFSTSARVHPSYLPSYIHTASKSAKAAKWIPPALAVAAVGYGVSAYRQQAQQIDQMPAASDAAERRRRQAALVLDDAYGDRTSLEGLERAMRVYEAQQQQQ